MCLRFCACVLVLGLMAGVDAAGDCDSLSPAVAAAPFVLVKLASLGTLMWTQIEAEDELQHLRSLVVYMKEELQARNMSASDVCDPTLINYQRRWLDDIPTAIDYNRGVMALMCLSGACWLVAMCMLLATGTSKDSPLYWLLAAGVGVVCNAFAFAFAFGSNAPMWKLRSRYSDKFPAFITDPLAEAVGTLWWSVIEFPVWVGACVLCVICYGLLRDVQCPQWQPQAEHASVSQNATVDTTTTTTAHRGGVAEVPSLAVAQLQLQP